jgi:hypothetical protein
MEVNRLDPPSKDEDYAERQMQSAFLLPLHDE